VTVVAADGPSCNSAAVTCRAARTRRRSQRTPPGKVTAEPRSTSAAVSMLRADAATATAASTSANNPGSRAARKSGNKLNVRWPSGQYHRAIRTPCGVARA